MQRILAISTVTLSLGASAQDDTPSASLTDRLLTTIGLGKESDGPFSNNMRRTEGWSYGIGCYDSTGALVQHGSHIAGGDHCTVYSCNNGEWIQSTRNDPRCRDDLSLGVGPLPSAGPAGDTADAGKPSARDGTLTKIATHDTSNPGQTLSCPLPTYMGNDKWTCPDQTLSLEQRRTLFDAMKPFDEINGLKLDDYWPATAGKTVPLAQNYEYDYEGISFKGYRLSRPTGERAPIHYHEVSQQLCLESGKIMVITDGEEDRFYQAPDCYMMPAYTKVSVISLETKVEQCLLRVPHGGLDWIVIEPKYYDLQGQWTQELSSESKH